MLLTVRLRLLQFLLHRDVARDLGEAYHRQETVASLLALVVRADAVIPRFLDVAGDQVLAVVLQAAVGKADF
jgi:hypothetical protein